MHKGMMGARVRVCELAGVCISENEKCEDDNGLCRWFIKYAIEQTQNVQTQVSRVSNHEAKNNGCRGFCGPFRGLGKMESNSISNLMRPGCTNLTECRWCIFRIGVAVERENSKRDDLAGGHAVNKLCVFSRNLP